MKTLKAYLDTHIAVWFAKGETSRLSHATLQLLEGAELLVSPAVQLELEYLHEIGRFRLSSRDALRKLEDELNIQVCDLPFPKIVQVALDEKWTRDVFDRMIVAHARSNALSYLVSADEQIQKNYLRTIS